MVIQGHFKKWRARVRRSQDSTKTRPAYQIWSCVWEKHSFLWTVKMGTSGPPCPPPENSSTVIPGLLTVYLGTVDWATFNPYLFTTIWQRPSHPQSWLSKTCFVGISIVKIDLKCQSIWEGVMLYSVYHFPSFGTFSALLLNEACSYLASK